MGDGPRLIEQDDSGLLCPNYGHPLHRLAVQIQNALYRAAERDSGGEVAEHHRKLLNAARDACPQYMRLYRVTATPSDLGWRLSGGYVEGWYWQCPTCETVIPGAAQRR